MQRVYKRLAKQFGEEYALLVMFTMRTGIELHRAWHMTLLTSKILQQLKDRFRLRMTWNLGVFLLRFRVQDGGNELYRKVPYDYDSEYQVRVVLFVRRGMRMCLRHTILTLDVRFSSSSFYRTFTCELPLPSWTETLPSTKH